MKKIYLSLFLLTFGVSTSRAQLSEESMSQASQPPLLSKRGTHILPEAGDWGLGIDTYPFFYYFASLFNNNSIVNSPWLSSAGNPNNNAALSGKYFINANTAYRGSVGLIFGHDVRSGSNIEYSPDSDPYNPNVTIDIQRNTFNNVALAFGIEKRRGSTRLQGKYGADAYIGYSSNDIYYQYANEMNSNVPQPATYNFGSNLPYSYNSFNFHRAIHENLGRRFSTGIRGFLGLEYFLAPKISIGGEFGYNLGITYHGRPSTLVEVWNHNISARQEIQIESNRVIPNSRSLSFGTGLNNLSSSINMHFYF
jgi:hypothetical protein